MYIRHIDKQLDKRTLCFQLKQTRIEYDADQLELINQQKRRESQAHLVNLNEDPMLAGVVVHILNDGIRAS